MKHKKKNKIMKLKDIFDSDYSDSDDSDSDDSDSDDSNEPLIVKLRDYLQQI